MTAATEPHDHTHPIDTRLRISALWIAVLFIFAYVDLFSLYRPDVRADLDAGRISAFDINEAFLFFTTLYIVIPSLMVYLTLVMRPSANRAVNTLVAAAYALTIAASAIGEWGYFILGSLVEVVLLALVVRNAWALPQPTRDPIHDRPSLRS